MTGSDHSRKSLATMAPVALLQIVAMGCISLAVIKPQPTISASSALIGLILFAWSLKAGDPRQMPTFHLWAAFSALAVIALSVGVQIGPAPESLPSWRPIWLALVLLSVVVGFFAKSGTMARQVSIWLIAISFVLATVALVVGDWNSGTGTDVYLAHKAAGSALLAGQNPYTDAVTIANGSPYAEPGSVIRGYTYPPVVLFTYGLVAAVTDPRLVATFAWAAVIGWLVFSASRRGDRADRAFAVLLIVASAPTWPIVWFTAWTEPLSATLFLLSAILWRKGSKGSGVALGLAIASKQYFVFLLPLMLLHREPGNTKRVAIASGVAGLTMLPFLIANPGALVEATIVTPARFGFRPDSQSLSGLLNSIGTPLELPLWAWMAVGSAGAVFLSQRSDSVYQFVARGALVLGLVFITGVALPNYWFLVFSLMAICTVLGPDLKNNLAGRRTVEA